MRRESLENLHGVVRLVPERRPAVKGHDADAARFAGLMSDINPSFTMAAENVSAEIRGNQKLRELTGDQNAQPEAGEAERHFLEESDTKSVPAIYSYQCDVASILPQLKQTWQFRTNAGLQAKVLGTGFEDRHDVRPERPKGIGDRPHSAMVDERGSPELALMGDSRTESVSPESGNSILSATLHEIRAADVHGVTRVEENARQAARNDAFVRLNPGGTASEPNAEPRGLEPASNVNDRTKRSIQYAAQREEVRRETDRLDNRKALETGYRHYQRDGQERPQVSAGQYASSDLSNSGEFARIDIVEVTAQQAGVVNSRFNSAGMFSPSAPSPEPSRMRMPDESKRIALPSGILGARENVDERKTATEGTTHVMPPVQSVHVLRYDTDTAGLPALFRNAGTLSTIEKFVNRYHSGQTTAPITLSEGEAGVTDLLRLNAADAFAELKSHGDEVTSISKSLERFASSTAMSGNSNATRQQDVHSGSLELVRPEALERGFRTPERAAPLNERSLPVDALIGRRAVGEEQLEFKRSEIPHDSQYLRVGPLPESIPVSSQASGLATIKPLHSIGQVWAHIEPQLAQMQHHTPPVLRQLKVRLKPDSLGEIDVTLKKDGHGIRVRLDASLETTALELRRGQAELATSLIQLGIDTSNLSIEIGTGIQADARSDSSVEGDNRQHRFDVGRHDVPERQGDRRGEPQSHEDHNDDNGKTRAPVRDSAGVGRRRGIYI
jgi:hypothetical protein